MSYRGVSTAGHSILSANFLEEVWMCCNVKDVDQLFASHQMRLPMQIPRPFARYTAQSHHSTSLISIISGMREPLQISQTVYHRRRKDEFERRRIMSSVYSMSTVLTLKSYIDDFSRLFVERMTQRTIPPAWAPETI
ncbi:cytochrome P450 [Penicillium vulpinum]|uniref:cytochrome P450 n=1 Tax=Penicillium vulpinum TaxID=29845 RepID=UPI0025484A86|nr:cytochrome P450 [Penicillium vulpinum]KAJ5958642.1 cytochrome P450 [Penicillium vulpinum]